MHRFLVLLALLSLACLPALPENANPPPNLRTHKAFHSRILANDRTITVLLPPGYDKTYRRYSVLYMHDGQALGAGEDTWRAYETAERLMRAHEIEPIIVVGIDNTGFQGRLDEYSPTNYTSPKSDGGYHGDGTGPRYARFVVEELKPFIDRTYRTIPDARHTGTAGGSMGGLISLYLGLWYPHVFGNLGVQSPSLWWDHELPLRQVQDLPAKLPLRIWLDIGTREDKNPGTDENNDKPGMMWPNARLLFALLSAKGWTPGADLSYYQGEGLPHGNGAFGKRMEPMLRFLFPG